MLKKKKDIPGLFSFGQIWVFFWSNSRKFFRSLSLHFSWKSFLGRPVSWISSNWSWRWRNGKESHVFFLFIIPGFLESLFFFGVMVVVVGVVAGASSCAYFWAGGSVGVGDKSTVGCRFPDVLNWRAACTLWARGIHLGGGLPFSWRCLEESGDDVRWHGEEGELWMEVEMETTPPLALVANPFCSGDFLSLLNKLETN